MADEDGKEDGEDDISWEGGEEDDVYSQLNYSRGGKRVASEGGKEDGEDDI